MKEVIHQWVKNKKGNLRGVVVAVKLPNNTYDVGWAMCHTQKEKQFNKEFGLNVAINRAKSHSNVPVPHLAKHIYDEMLTRGAKYFKGTSLATERRAGQVTVTA